MRLKILHDFNDKTSGKLMKTGRVVEFDEERAQELLAHRLKLVEIAPEKPKKND